MVILKKILFLCTGNSCRSQMAEGLARHLKSDCLDVYSAGIQPKGIDTLAVQVMQEIGIDISKQYSKHLDKVKHIGFDWIVTVCDHAHETCPILPGAKIVHVGFEDPPKLAESATSPEEKINCYRKIRDQIADFIKTLPESLEKI